MSKIKSFIIMCILVMFGFLMLFNSYITVSSVKFSMEIFKNNIFPSLFPFFVLSNMLISYGFVEFMGCIFKRSMNNIFKINGKCAFIFFMSIISGNPSNAKYTKELLLSGDINKYEAIKILCFTSFVNPLFILGTSSIFNSVRISFFILIIHYTSNIIIGLLIRNYHPSNIESKSDIKKAIILMHKKRVKSSFGSALTKSIVDSINTLLLILGVITVFLVITSLTCNYLNINSTIKCIIKGIIEMTQGIKYISLENISLKLKAILTVMILSFGGLSVHMQIMSILSDTNIKYFPIFLSRVCASIISGILMLIFFSM